MRHYPHSKTNTRDPVNSDQFAVTHLRFPDRQQIFPALVSREFLWQAIEFSAERHRRLGYLKPEIGEFPCIFPRNREMRSRDGFADDCLHRQLYLFLLLNFASRCFNPRIDPASGVTFWEIPRHARMFAEPNEAEGVLRPSPDPSPCVRPRLGDHDTSDHRKCPPHLYGDREFIDVDKT